MAEKSYNIDFTEDIVKADINRLTNQLGKLIPMRENNENGEEQLNTVLIEVVGLGEILPVDEKMLILLSKLEGLKKSKIEFITYRKTVFESISLLREVFHAA